jgi:hypothetical protein
MDTSASPIRPELRGYRLAWRTVAWTTVVLCGLAGLVTFGVVRSMVTMTLMAGVGALYGYVLTADLPRVRRPVRTSAVVCGAGTLVLVGVPGAAHGVGLGVLAVLVATSPPLVARLAVRVGAGADRMSVPSSGCSGLDSFDVLLQACDDNALAAAWYESEAGLREATTVEEVARIAGVRQLYLDELERRSPDDFSQWLATQSLDR